MGRTAQSRRKLNSRTAIVVAARKIFLKHGYAVNIDLIAQEAGVARTTLYNQFGNKENLLREMVRFSCQQFMLTFKYDEADDLGVLLKNMAKHFDDTAYTEQGVEYSRFYSADLANYPDLALLAYNMGMKSLTEVLAERLQRKMDRGEIRALDADVVAEQFLGAVIGFSRHRFFAGLGLDAPRERASYIARTVDLFVAALKTDK